MKAAARVAAAHLVRRRCPLSVTMLVTYRCNYRCTYCNSFNVPEAEIGTADARRVIDQFAAMGAIRVGFTGGEALVRDDIGELIAHAGSRGLFTTLVTNGGLVAEKASQLAGLGLLVVSLDGPPEVQDRYRGEGAFEHALEAIQRARRAGVRVVTNTVLNRDTLPHLEYVLDLARSLGFATFYQPIFVHPLSASHDVVDPLRPSPEDMRAAIRRILALRRRGYPVASSPAYLAYLARYWPDGFDRRCWAGRLFCVVTPSGRLAPCCFSTHSGDWPSILELGAERAFASLEPPRCRGCFCNVYIESNLMFQFRPSAILSALTQVGP